jgi:fructokinase
MRIGIDLGGTKIEGLALDAVGQELARIRVPTPAEGYEAIVNAVVDLVGALERQVGQQGSVGLGIPGVISPKTGLVKNANTTSLIGHPLDRDLERRLARPVRVANDANCFALSEATDGAASAQVLGVSDAVVFGVILGTGTGGGLVVAGRPIAGPDGIAGEWGHNPLPWLIAGDEPLPQCWCGQRGCIETFLSGPALARDHERVTGQRLTGPHIAEHSRSGDSAAIATLERYCERLARGLAAIINWLNPHAIVLGGGLSNLALLYQRVPELWTRHVFSDGVSTRLVAARHGDSSGVRGAAWLWPTVSPRSESVERASGVRPGES